MKNRNCHAGRLYTFSNFDLEPKSLINVGEDKNLRKLVESSIIGASSKEVSLMVGVAKCVGSQYIDL